jgi:hypothetical protein
VKLLHRRLEGRPINPLCSQVSWSTCSAYQTCERSTKCGNSGEEQMRATFARLENPAPLSIGNSSRRVRHRHCSDPRCARKEPIDWSPSGTLGWGPSFSEVLELPLLAHLFRSPHPSVTAAVKPKAGGGWTLRDWCC